jgi:hypothetical protein
LFIDEKAPRRRRPKLQSYAGRKSELLKLPRQMTKRPDSFDFAKIVLDDYDILPAKKALRTAANRGGDNRIS